MESAAHRTGSLRSAPFSFSLSPLVVADVPLLSFRYYMAGSLSDGTGCVWDLRKLKVVESFVLDDSDALHSARFDSTGYFLGLLSRQKLKYGLVLSVSEREGERVSHIFRVSLISIHSGTKGFPHVYSLDLERELRSFAFGADCRTIVGGSNDGHLALFAL